VSINLSRLLAGNRATPKEEEEAKTLGPAKLSEGVSPRLRLRRVMFVAIPSEDGVKTKGKTSSVRFASATWEDGVANSTD